MVEVGPRVNTIDGRKVRLLREQRGWTQQELGTRARLGQGTVSRIESGRKPHNYASTLEKLAAVFDVTTDELLTNGSPYRGVAHPPAQEYTGETPAEPPLDLADPRLKLYLNSLGDLPPEDQRILSVIIAEFLERNRRRREQGQ